MKPTKPLDPLRCLPPTRRPIGESCFFPTCRYVAIAASAGAAAEAMLDHQVLVHHAAALGLVPAGVVRIVQK